MTQPLTRGEAHRPEKREWLRFKLLVVSLLDACPPLKRLLLCMWYKRRIFRYRWKSKKLARQHGGESDLDRTYWVDPESIRYSSLEEFNIYRDKGKIVGGDWDQLEKRFEDLDVYLAFEERFVRGKRWEDTLYYRRVLDEMRNGAIMWDCKNRSDLDRRCESLDLLFQNMKNNGYKSRREMLSEANTCDPIQAEDEITVNVGRHGDLLFNNGAHRLAVARLLGIRKIPVKITVRHRQWVNLRGQISLYAKDQPSGKIYQAITHPDLQDLPSFHDSECDRFNIIQENLSVRKGRLLDIGAHWGYFCHKFEEMGFDCYAVEIDRVNLYFLEKLKRAENRRFKVIPESVFEWQGIEDSYFDVVLALNIFHHFLNDRSTYLKLLNLLRKMNLKEMYFQPHHDNESHPNGAYKYYSEQEFVEFILQASNLNNAVFLGRAQDGRGIYRLC